MRMISKPDSPSPAPTGYLVQYHWWVGLAGAKAVYNETQLWHIENAVGRPLCGCNAIPVRADRTHEHEEWIDPHNRCPDCQAICKGTTLSRHSKPVAVPEELVPPRPDQFLWKVTTRGRVSPINGYSLPGTASIVIRDPHVPDPTRFYRVQRREIKDEIHETYEAAMAKAAKHCERRLATAERELRDAQRAKERCAAYTREAMIEELQQVAAMLQKAHAENGGQIILDD